jgi:ribosomal protein L25 (general stress protein Ctc)
MEKVVLNATKRDVVGKQVRALRREGKLPAVIYGRHTEPLNINLDAHTASLALGKVTSSSLVTINLDGTEYPALVREKQRDYIKNHLLHVDFLAVLLNDPDTMVAVATFAKVEEEAAAVPGAEGVTPSATEPELAVERGKKEDEGEE